MHEETIPTPIAQSYWDADPFFRAVVKRSLPGEAWQRAETLLARMGERAALEVAPLAAIADRQSPRHVSHDARGQRIDLIEYHPAYRRMEEIAYGDGIVAVKYEPSPLFPCRHRVGFALGYLFGQAESGLFCPACMTDGVARVIEKFGSDDQKRRHIPRLAARRRPELWTGAMFLTEKAGGSDVGGGTFTRARREADSWRISGEKWFCSNVDAELCLALARPEGAPEGTKGLGLFLVPRDLPDGRRNGLRIERIKEKLGVRSMPTGEVTLDDAEAELVGEERRGFHMMTEMLNLSRLYNSVAALSAMRRAVYEARHFISERRAFGRPVIEHPLARAALLAVEERLSRHTLLVWRVVELLDRADGGDADAAVLSRCLTPLIKYTTGKSAVWGVSECLELHGGQGYIEESVMPRLLRDAQVLPIWEGTTNILVLDTVRALRREAAVDRVLALLDGAGRAVASSRNSLRRDLVAATEGRYPEAELRTLTDRLAQALESAEAARAGDCSDLARFLPAAAVPAV